MLLQVLQKSRIMSSNLLRYAVTERNILAYIRHPYIVSLHYAFQTPSHLVLVLQYCPRGNLQSVAQLSGCCHWKWLKIGTASCPGINVVTPFSIIITTGMLIWCIQNLCGTFQSWEYHHFVYIAYSPFWILWSGWSDAPSQVDHVTPTTSYGGHTKPCSSWDTWSCFAGFCLKSQSSNGEILLLFS